MLNDKDIKKFKKRITYAFKKLSGRYDGAEDCAQEILTRMLEGKHQHSTIDQCVIDYLRLESGRKGSSGYDSRKALAHANPYEPSRNFDTSGSSVRIDLGDRLDYERLLKLCGGQISRACFKLWYKWELNGIEIGDIFGFSESRVNQRIKEVQKRLSERIKAEKSRAARERTKKMEGILSAQAKDDMWRVEQDQDQGLETIKSFSMATLNEESF